MSAKGATNSVWVWCAVEADRDVPFQHPANVPVDDEALAKLHFVDKVRGPRFARISPATLLQAKGNTALIAERGATREVPKPFVLPWYEGLLLLEEIERSAGQDGHIQAAWVDPSLRAILDQERGRFRSGQLNGALYAEKRLATIAVTGSHFVDGDNRAWSYRRENLRSDEKAVFEEGTDDNDLFKMKEILGYLPPWEAFCHERCGFYQDFYQVRWEYPFSEIDYSEFENGCVGATGATWEPDECLSAHLDPLRIAAKRAWIKTKREQGQKGPPLKRQRSETDAADESQGAAARVSEEPANGRAVPRVLRRKRRDGMPLDRDLMRSAHAHDFAPGDYEKKLAGIRSGWPKTPAEYPEGYGVASPPGFCRESCDCMDDQRTQRAWEMHKVWLEETVRSEAARNAIEVFSQNTRFVRRRGLVSKICYFETASGWNNGEQAHAKAALDLAKLAEKAIGEVLGRLPVHALREVGAPLHLPALACLREEHDYDPVVFDAVAGTGGSLPPWLRVDFDSGRVTAAAQAPSSFPPTQVRVELSHAEGAATAMLCTVTAEQLGGSSAPWTRATGAIAQAFGDSNLHRSARAALQERFSELYDFKDQAARIRTVNEWLDTMSVIVRMLRSTAVANITVSPAHARGSPSAS